MIMEDGLHWLRSFYRRYLARYLWMRKLKPLVVRAYFGYRHLQYLVSWLLQPFLLVIARNLPGKLRFCTPFFAMVTLEKYCKDENLQTYELVMAESIALTMPEVHPEQLRKRLHTDSWSSATPSVQAIEIPDAQVMGRCDFVFVQSRCLHHGLYCWERDSTAEEVTGLLGIDVKRKLVTSYAKSKDAVIEVDKAISLIGSASTNYVHWLTETAPKLALIDEVDELKAYPLIIDSGLHPNILESLNCLNIHNRAIVQLERGQLCQVDKLISITPVAYAPFDYRRGFAPEREGMDPGWAMFVPRALHALRAKLLPRMGSCGPAPGRRLYLRRNSQFRPIRNAGEVEALLSELGFQVVEPEKLSFAEQVKLFSATEVIVAQAGAALGNIIFAPQGCRVVILSAWSPYNIYYYFSNIASIFGQKCTYMLCEPDTRDNVHPAHYGLKLDIQALRRVIDQ